PAPKYLSANLSHENAIREGKKTPLPIPPPSADAHRILLVAAVCRRWRGLAQRCVSALLVRENLAVSRQALASAVAALPNLTHLHLCDGSVETLDDSFLAHLASSCPNLAILHVGRRIAAPVGSGNYSDREVEKISFFELLTSLERLEIVNDYMRPDSKLLTYRFGELVPCLRELTLRQRFWRYDVGSVELPITLLTLLESLILSECNWLQSLPPIEIGRLHSLKTLVLHKLPLVGSLPDSLCHLPSLETFLLIQCGSTSHQALQLPEAFCRLTTLQTLAIVKTPQVGLPWNIGELPRLHALYLNGHNQRPRLPVSFTHLTALTRLELSLCTIRELPEGLGSLTNLQELHIRSCPLLKKLPDSLTSLSSLETLTVDDCVKLVSIPRRLDSLGRLKWLELTGCYDQTQPPTSLPLSLEVLEDAC
ncbi:unnamed protein product, partial [Closterium sp. NIES-54]